MQEISWFVPKDSEGAGGAGEHFSAGGGVWKPLGSFGVLGPAATGGGGKGEGVLSDEMRHEGWGRFDADEPLPFGETVFICPLTTLGMEDPVLRGGALPEGFLEYNGGVGDGSVREIGPGCRHGTIRPILRRCQPPAERRRDCRQCYENERFHQFPECE
jgi:hypothetical protein